MRVRSAAVPLAILVLAAGAVNAEAAPKKKPKPITKSYTVSATPYPYPPTGPSCSESTEGATEHRETLKVTGAGKLVVEVRGFTGDWDIGLYDKAGTNLAMGAGSDTPNTDTAPSETLTYKSKKAQTLYIDVCNFLGTPSATAKYTYTYS
jgi:hypothetical protein